ncbi:CTP--2,3-di-O-geranylgeranyl-sn-glycero-1-phosphate cytidyltransferase [Methanolobus mangrovi]|uniref:CTP--2, 3-di-O-geranylgeranyl-sn-glycero-1-phosphate cytidyltransferase n=1 Tax=Methanolobus mangrovi TaxID=3072977 RepID=A0AA51YK24_9EURY|nr:CTP--2,3-di-O-geranylgeranyl-sn-glycero-1-phosphate cytidyltransferase [Methanolobus mangrovi]WMW23193.1 CTP--2,3-di-O-geranylgeranyl-sn-glycero-1-phosphate cytidyltransferase [Methanolobus mangrovi]
MFSSKLNSRRIVHYIYSIFTMIYTFIYLKIKLMAMASISFTNELMRKGIHLTSILIILVYAFFGKQETQTLLIVYLVLIMIIEHLRLDRGIKLPVFHILLRQKEKSGIGSHVYFTLGALVAVSVFSKNIAFAAILMTTFGDMSAALIGKRFGKIRIFGNGKSLEGCISEFIVDIFIVVLLIQNPFVSVFMAFVATYVETTFVKIDDNIAIPVFSGAFAELAFLLIPH